MPERGSRGLVVLPRRGRRRLLAKALEPGQVELRGVDPQLVAGRTRDQDARRLATRPRGLEQLAQRRDVALQGGGRGRGRPFAPELLDQSVGGDDLAVLQQEQRQGRALLRAPERHSGPPLCGPPAARGCGTPSPAATLARRPRPRRPRERPAGTLGRRQRREGSGCPTPRRARRAGGARLTTAAATRRASSRAREREREAVVCGHIRRGRAVGRIGGDGRRGGDAVRGVGRERHRRDQGAIRGVRGDGHGHGGAAAVRGGRTVRRRRARRARARRPRAP